jgi:hypothetical protein
MKKIQSNLIRALHFEHLKMFEFFDLVMRIMEYVFTPTTASEIGLGHAYTSLKRAYERLEVQVKRNPALRQTELIADLMSQIRQSLVLLRAHIKLALYEPDLHESARIVDHIASPYLKQSYYTTQSGIAGTAYELTIKLKKSDIIEHTTALGLLDKVNALHQLQQQLNDLLDARANAVGHNKVTGSPTAHRRRLEAELRNVLFTLLPALHQIAPTAAARERIETVAFHLNAQLDSFRHLLISHNTAENGDDNNDGADSNEGGDAAVNVTEEIIIELPQK